MKFRESGMPNEPMWNTFFKPSDVLEMMDVNNTVQVLLDIGCGYGTFLIPASVLVQKKAIGIDIEDEMINTCLKKVKSNKLNKIELLLGDITSDITRQSLEKYKGMIDYITLFNILHCETPIELLKAAYHLLKENGKIGVIHWNYEDTPRGPSMDIRPTPDKIREWAELVGLTFDKQVDLKPYHYGLVFHK